MYGSVAGVKAYIRHIDLDTPKGPTTEDVERWLGERSAILDGWIAGAGYVTPVTQPGAAVALGRYANVGAAGDAELAQRGAGYSKDSQNKRENKFLAEFAAAEAWIKSGALGALDVPLVGVWTASTVPLIGTLTAGTQDEDPARQGRHISLDYPLGRRP